MRKMLNLKKYHLVYQLSVWVFLLSMLQLFAFRAGAEGKRYSFLSLNTNNGLVNNQVKSIMKDSRGFIWIGTSSGLSRFDGNGFKNYTHDGNDTTSIIDNFILSIQETAEGNILVRTRWEYTLFDVNREIFLKPGQFFTQYGDFENIHTIYIDKSKKIWFRTHGHHYFMTPDENGQLIDPFEHEVDNASEIADFYHDGKNYYYLHASGLIECYNGRNHKLIFQDNYLEGKLGADAAISKIFIDNEKDLWIYGNNVGCYYLQSAVKQWNHFNSRSGKVRLSSNLISKIIQDNDGIIWIATDHGGIDLYDKSNHTLSTLYHHNDDPGSLAQNSITDICRDNFGIVWIGTYKNGISYYHESIHKFPLYLHLSSDKNSLPFNDVNCFAEDRKGNLWIGTNGGGLLYYDRSAGNYEVFRHDPNTENSLSSDVVVSLFIDDADLLWIGTYTGGINTFDGRSFTRYRLQDDGQGGLPNDNIWSINQDNQKRIWIGTLGSGIVLYDKSSGTFNPVPNYGDLEPLPGFITRISKMRNGNMFIGTGHGIYFYDMGRQQFQNHPFFENEPPFAISNANVNDVYEDSRGFLWVATREGLTMIDPNMDYIRIFGRQDNFTLDIMNCILEDDDKAIWVSKSSGLSQIKINDDNPESDFRFEVKNFNKSDGLQAEEFNVNASLKTSRGELIFGGPNGFNLFLPGNISYNTILPDVVFTDFQIFNRSVGVGEKIKGKVVLSKSIVSTHQIEIRHSMNVFSIEFAALNYFISDKVKYKYMMEGFDREWVESNGGMRKVTYTNLNAGNYVFKVKASNNDGFWNEEFAELAVIILPPFYRSIPAYIIYFILVLAILLYYRYSMLRKERLKFKIEQERIMAKRHLEMDEVKLRFLTNVSHEFRTPLSLILAPLEKLMKTKRETGEMHLLETIDRNARQLLDLVNQLLDFRKLDLHGLKYNPSYGDIIGFLKGVCDNFKESFRRKGIKFHFSSSLDSFHTQFDHEKLQKVMMNLLSNALKFTQSKGQISVLVEPGADLHSKNIIVIKVSDTGIGIPEEEREKIFDRFYQSERNHALGLSGSGIGLNLVREMVQLHQGTVEVESEVNKGTTFIVKLPVEEVSRQPVSGPSPIQQVKTAEPIQELPPITSRQSILLVEDNADFRSFMKETLLDRYDIFEAADGEQGMQSTHANFPDIIISDVMMPVMDGLELCRQIKSDVRTSHIPVILLTARTADEDKIRGLEIGADDYITKPFNMDLLLLRIQHLIDKQKKIHDRFRKKMDVNPSEIEISSIDEKLIKKAIALVEENIAEPKFSVEDLSHELGMSRVYLYKKLLTITGKTPIEFIRIIRLKRGASLLQKSQMTISEVAYAVGFNSPRYFSKYFEEEFGVLPSEYLKSVKVE
jgi:signal transduction histidine kinase/DNA-binding response OmpR family regulator/ligand-binding sensor domain-containing protein